MISRREPELSDEVLMTALIIESTQVARTLAISGEVALVPDVSCCNTARAALVVRKEQTWFLPSDTLH